MVIAVVKLIVIVGSIVMAIVVAAVAMATAARLPTPTTSPEACRALEDIGVDVYGLIDNIDFIFADNSDAFGENMDKDRALAGSPPFRAQQNLGRVGTV